MDIYEIFAAVQRAVDAHYFTYESERDKATQISILAAILDLDDWHIKFCLYLIEVYSYPEDTLSEMLDDARTMTKGELSDKYEVSTFIAGCAKDEAEILDRNADDDEDDDE